ncbi:uncharacterized protein EI97DRAFT_99982 [Westerdykella ornata]|uniref:Uncharacterized protein n=1 Tax=Westerdykella ornata TaxID=318751 RepID=A0A6A6JDV7_WESOR|nr:uncharacterized protein EI97DRAFT_99982 [Westerdykella ornata]KAF2274455.1 hypothetical protein EI97DRAFT_99982 [Westerdykella ornata]
MNRSSPLPPNLYYTDRNPKTKRRWTNLSAKQCDRCCVFASSSRHLLNEVSAKDQQAVLLQAKYRRAYINLQLFHADQYSSKKDLLRILRKLEAKISELKETIVQLQDENTNKQDANDRLEYAAMLQLLPHDGSCAPSDVSMRG